jgi:thioredoxin 1
MKTLSTTDFQTQVFDFTKDQEWDYKGDLPAIIDFYADWCGPCKALSPILADLEKEFEGKIHIFKVDTEASPDLAAAFGIRSIPSLLFVPQKGQPAMAAGLLPKDDLREAIHNVLGVK